MMSLIAWLWAFSFLIWCLSWWLAYRRKKLLFWLFWNTVMGFVCWMLALSGAVGGIWILLLWYASLLVVPTWWLLTWESMRPPRPHRREDYSDLKPIVDEHGKQRYP